MKLVDVLLARAWDALPAALRARVVVFGSAPMVLAGLRDDVNDLDLFADEAAFDELIRAGFAVGESPPGVPCVRLAEGIEVYRTWPGVGFDEVLAGSAPDARARGLRVAGLAHVRAYKRAAGREKDRADLAALDRALGSEP